ATVATDVYDQAVGGELAEQPLELVDEQARVVDVEAEDPQVAVLAAPVAHVSGPEDRRQRAGNVVAVLTAEATARLNARFFLDLRGGEQALLGLLQVVRLVVEAQPRRLEQAEVLRRERAFTVPRLEQQPGLVVVVQRAVLRAIRQGNPVLVGDLPAGQGSQGDRVDGAGPPGRVVSTR